MHRIIAVQASFFIFPTSVFICFGFIRKAFQASVPTDPEILFPFFLDQGKIF
jgi:hypothetical protein